MQISVSRRGGFAGLSETLATADTATLDAARSEPLKRSIDGVHFFELADKIDSGEVGTDLYEYTVTVKQGGRQHAVSFLGGESPRGPLAELVDMVKSLK